MKAPWSDAYSCLNAAPTATPESLGPKLPGVEESEPSEMVLAMSGQGSILQVPTGAIRVVGRAAGAIQAHHSLPGLPP